MTHVLLRPDGDSSVVPTEPVECAAMPAAAQACWCRRRSKKYRRVVDGFVVLTLGTVGGYPTGSGNSMPGVCCCGTRLHEPNKPRKRRGEVTPVEPRPPAAAASAATIPAATDAGPAAAPRRLVGASVSGSPSRTNRRKPRSFEAPATPKVANVRKPRSFGAEGWLKVDLPVDESPEDMVWYRRVRNIVTTEHRNASNAASGDLVPLHGGLYVGDRADAQNMEQLRRLGITHVLNCATAAETGTGVSFYAERASSAAAPPIYLELGAADSDSVNYIAPNLPVRPVLYSKLAPSV
eukprot:COSAG02_NODE_8360_length_2598_cov_3.812725_3_plen_294_part_00